MASISNQGTGGVGLCSRRTKTIVSNGKRLLLLIFDTQHDVAGVGDKSHRLSDDQHGIEAEAGISHDDARPHQADDPEAYGKNGGMNDAREPLRGSGNIA